MRKQLRTPGWSALLPCFFGVCLLPWSSSRAAVVEETAGSSGADEVGWYEYLPSMDTWGASAVPPRGMFGFRYKFDHAKVVDWFNPQGEKAPLMPPYDFMGGSLDFGASIGLNIHTFALVAGIVENVAVRAEIALWGVTPEFNYSYQPPDSLEARVAAEVVSCVYGVEKFTESLEGLLQTMELFGRPPLPTEVGAQPLLPGDFRMGIGWNYYRRKRVSLLSYVQGTFPTGHVANPDENLFFGLGTDVDVGFGCWGVGIGQVVDFHLPRPLDWILVTAEVDYAYYFKTTRDSPTVFTKPAPGITEAVNLIGLDPGPILADMSDLGPTYEFQPGNLVIGTLQVMPTFFHFLPVALGLQTAYSPAATFKSNSKAFVDYINALGFFDESYRLAVYVRPSVNLFELVSWLPMKITFGWNRVFWGKTAFILDDSFELALETMLPVSFW